MIYHRLLCSLVCCCVCLLAACSDSGSDGVAGTGNTPESGTGGSLARFMVVGNTLYTISGSNLKLLYISDPVNPVEWQNIPISFDIETLFSYGDYLFIGSETGVYIYDNTNPEFPEFVSLFTHARACDPVVVQGNYAYVTLRSNTRCRGARNQLDIIDVSDVTQPMLVRTYGMIEPKGLGIDGSLLFVCDGRAGLKVFDVVDPLNIAVAETQPTIVCNDVIPNNGKLVITADAGVYQYDYSQLPMRFLSQIEAR